MYQLSDQSRSALEGLSMPLALFQNIGEQNIPLLVSDGFCSLLGIGREQLMEEQRGSKFDRIHPDDVGNMSQAVRRFWRKDGNYDVLYRIRCADNTYHTIHSVAFWWTMEEGSELIVVIYLSLDRWEDESRKVSDHYSSFQQDHFYIDQLTGLPNINYLNQFADERINMIRVHGGTPVLIYSDTHSMQSYNNQYGFVRGNELLVLIAKELKAAFPDGLIMRAADDHFVVIDAFPGREELTEKINAMDDIIRKSAYGNTSGIQAGIVLYGENTTTAEAVDQARMSVKQIKNDLNRVVQFHSQEDDEAYWNQRYIIEHFDRALAEGWIRIYYQCISRVETDKGAALEALARWIDPVRGIIPPGEFIPVLRRYHLLYKLDLYMIEQVCREIPIRVENGFQLLPVSVNFAAQDFDYLDVPAEINALYDRYGIGSYAGKEYFIIEITEQDIASGSERFYEQLQVLKDSGYRLWLDDFGSGYSSLSMFSRFDFHLIKFDMDLLRHLEEHNGANRRIIRAMIGVARDLGIHTLAEGMETEEHRQFLKECGCELAQGYLFHKPEPLDIMLYRRNNGQKPRATETPEEREAWIRMWFR